jgi:hypothetical protein
MQIGYLQTDLFVSRLSRIDDLTQKESEYKGEAGYPILFDNAQICKMLTLAGAGPNDVFFDLGCGWGQNLKIALTEFNVKRDIGIESNKKRWQKARNRLKRLDFPNERWHVIKGKYETLLEGKSTEEKLEEATIVFFGILSDPENIDSLENKLSRGCKLIWYYNCSFLRSCLIERNTLSMFQKCHSPGQHQNLTGCGAWFFGAVLHCTWKRSQAPASCGMNYRMITSR